MACSRRLIVASTIVLAEINLFKMHADRICCRWLRQYAEQGDFAGAEDRLEKMRNEKLFPGPKAYHALIYSYVKGGNPHGALKALRDASKKVKGRGRRVGTLNRVWLFMKFHCSICRFSTIATNLRCNSSRIPRNWRH